MKNPQVTRFVLVLLTLATFAGCRTREPFMYARNPFEDGLLGSGGALENRQMKREMAQETKAREAAGLPPEPEPAPMADEYFGRGQTEPALLTKLKEGTKKKETVAQGPVTPAGESGEASEDESTRFQAPTIHEHRGAPGTICYTCNGKGYVLHMGDRGIGSPEVCPVCQGNRRY